MKIEDVDGEDEEEAAKGNNSDTKKGNSDSGAKGDGREAVKGDDSESKGKEAGKTSRRMKIEEVEDDDENEDEDNMVNVNGNATAEEIKLTPPETHAEGKPETKDIWNNEDVAASVAAETVTEVPEVDSIKLENSGEAETEVNNTSEAVQQEETELEETVPVIEPEETAVDGGNESSDNNDEETDSSKGTEEESESMESEREETKEVSFKFSFFSIMLLY